MTHDDLETPIDTLIANIQALMESHPVDPKVILKLHTAVLYRAAPNQLWREGHLCVNIKRDESTQYITPSLTHVIATPTEDYMFQDTSTLQRFLKADTHASTIAAL